MAAEAPHVAQAQPIRDLHIPSSFQIQAVDENFEKSLGHDGRQALRKEFGIGEDRSILHPDLPKFRFGAAPPSRPDVQKPIQPEQEEPFPNGAAKGSLGIALDKFVGKFQGRGFNTILRPQNGAKGRPNTVSDNLFEINFTHETLEFLDWTVLRDVPNRGFDMQEDVNLRGIPYTQKVRDLTNIDTGKVDDPSSKGVAIHFEQGLFMRTPALIPWADETFTKKGPATLAPTITRMASIPHGTTINAQSLDPTGETATAPVFKDLDKQIIFPFTLSEPKRVIPFPQISVDDGNNVNRLPVNIRKFRDAKTINKTQLDNPNNFLKENNDKKTIIKHITFTVDSKPTFNLWGGGSDNFAQLAERPINTPPSALVVNDPDLTGKSTANANAVRVTCQYWISTVEDTIKVPVFDQANLTRKNPDPLLRDKPDNINWPVAAPVKVDGIDKPSFAIQLPKNEKEFNAKVRYIQIQYSQNVFLDFGALRWPHVSVATLVPADPVPITSESLLQRV